jgi:hypothetical protein
MSAKTTQPQSSERAQKHQMTKSALKEPTGLSPTCQMETLQLADAAHGLFTPRHIPVFQQLVGNHAITRRLESKSPGNHTGPGRQGTFSANLIAEGSLHQDSGMEKIHSQLASVGRLQRAPQQPTYNREPIPQDPNRLSFRRAGSAATPAAAKTPGLLGSYVPVVKDPSVVSFLWKLHGPRGNVLAQINGRSGQPIEIRDDHLPEQRFPGEYILRCIGYNKQKHPILYFDRDIGPDIEAAPGRQICFIDEYRLRYEGEDDGKCISKSRRDPEFDDLFDKNIKRGDVFAIPETTWENVKYNRFRLLLLTYNNGKSEFFALNDIPDFGKDVIVAATDYEFLKRKTTGLIYPVQGNKLVLNEELTPKIMEYKNGLKWEIKKLQDAYTLIQAIGAFASIMGMYSSVEGSSSSGFHESIRPYRKVGRAPSAKPPGRTGGAAPHEPTGGAKVHDQSTTAGVHDERGGGGKGGPKKQQSSTESPEPASTTEQRQEPSKKTGAKEKEETRSQTTSGKSPHTPYINNNPKATAREVKTGEFLHGKAQDGEIPGFKAVEGAAETPGKGRNGDYRFVRDNGDSVRADVYHPETADWKKTQAHIYKKSGQAEIVVVEFGYGESGKITNADAKVMAQQVVETEGLSINQVIIVNGGRIIASEKR